MEHPQPFAEFAFAGLNNRLTATEEYKKPAAFVVPKIHMLQYIADEIPSRFGADPALHGKFVETVEKEEKALFAGVWIERIAREYLGKPHVVADSGDEGA